MGRNKKLVQKKLGKGKTVGANKHILLREKEEEAGEKTFTNETG